MPPMDMTATANASLTPMETASAMSLKSKDVPTKQHATTMQMQPTKPSAHMPQKVTTVMANALQTLTETESVTNLKSRGASTLKRVTT